MAIPLVFSLIYQSFPKELNFRVTLILHTLYTVWAILVLTLPIHLILEHLYIMIGFSIVCILYLFFATGLAVFRKRNYSMAHFFSLIFLIICALFDLVMISNPRDVFFLSQFGACIYLMIQSLLILLRLIRAHKLSLRLTKELEKTNQNLENMVESRTLELQGSKRELEKNVQHTDFLIKTISHDLKSSFHILMSFSDMLLKEENQAGQQRELLQAMSVTSRNSHEMLDNILGWARIQKNGSAERHIIRNLDGIIHSCMSQLNDRIIAKSLNIKTGIDKTLTFSCDEAQLENILLNLLSNGIKFCAPGSDISFSNNLSNEKVEIHIQDSGIGIAPDMLANLFDYTKDKRRKGTSGELGSGLGLFIVHELVENNDGEIACTSEVGQGTHFILRFPFAE
jgi:signal transduction histidine kinase